MGDVKLSAAGLHATELTAYTDFAQNSVSVDDERLIAILDGDIEHSQLYARANIHGFVEEPLFSWYIDACKVTPRENAANRIIRALRDVLIRLSFYQMEDLSAMNFFQPRHLMSRNNCSRFCWKWTSIDPSK